MPKKIEEYPLLPLFHKFINEAKKGKHLQKNGKKIKTDSLNNYVYLENLLIKFSEEKVFHIRILNSITLTKKQFDNEQKYWKNFYHLFTSYLYDELGHFDNYVGRLIKLLRSFFNYLITEKGLNVGSFHKKFYAPHEEIEIIVLTPERLNYLIHDKELHKKLTPDLKKVKDVFVFGCSVALRYSDLIALNKTNLEVINERVYIKVQSKKTQTFTRVKIPEYAIQIIKKYEKLYRHKLLPEFNNAFFNKKIKNIMQHYGFTEPIGRTRLRRGIPITIYKDKKSKSTFRFCDSVTTHTMRRSGITTLLSLGMKEQMVRQISGHSANSKDFFRYVSFAQTYIDKEIDDVYEKFNNKRLEFDTELSLKLNF